MEGPWLDADTPAGTPMNVGGNVYWKIEVVNTGEVDLELEYIDYYDGVILDLEDLTDARPSSVEAGTTVTINYNMHVFSGIHKNSIKVIGTFTNLITEDEDNAYYTGVQSLSISRSDKIPAFVIPEFPLGALGGLLSLLTAFAYSHIRRKS